MKFSNNKKKRKGYTLIELTVVLVLVVLIATTLVSMLSQQVQFYTWWNTQKFIAEDAPLTNTLVVRLLAKADNGKIYTDKATALAGGAGVTANGTVLLLDFAQADGATIHTLIEYDSAEEELRYNILNAAGSAVDSSWVITSGVANASFDLLADGVSYQFTLTGPYGGQLTFATSPSI